MIFCLTILIQSSYSFFLALTCISCFSSYFYFLQTSFTLVLNSMSSSFSLIQYLDIISNSLLLNLLISVYTYFLRFYNLSRTSFSLDFKSNSFFQCCVSCSFFDIKANPDHLSPSSLLTLLSISLANIFFSTSNLLFIISVMLFLCFSRISSNPSVFLNFSSCICFKYPCSNISNFLDTGYSKSSLVPTH